MPRRKEGKQKSFENLLWLDIEKIILICKKISKVFEEKGGLLNFKANIDPMAMLSQVKPG